LLEYHAATKHSLQSVQSGGFQLDWANQPLAFKIYTSLEPQELPHEFTREPPSTLDRSMLARLCYFANGVTKVLRGMPFRAAACTGALYHIELYLICSELDDLEAGVYHYAAHDNALRQLRRGDYRALVGSARVSIVFTSTFWRNAWKYQSRAYRHAFWDSGTVLANLFAVASSAGIDASLQVAFADREINALLDVDPDKEASVAVVALGGDCPVPELPLDVPPLQCQRGRCPPTKSTIR
jgi:SagB-type dehydrogenase family enzyme